jgi:di/tricarboxylate transporter
MTGGLIESTYGLISGLKKGHVDPKITIGLFSIFANVAGLIPERNPENPQPKSLNLFKSGVKDPARLCATIFTPAAIAWFVEAVQKQSPSLMAVAVIGGAGTGTLLFSKEKFPKKTNVAGKIFIVSSAMVLIGGVEQRDLVHTTAGLLFTIGSVVAAELKTPSILKDKMKRDQLISSFTESVIGLTAGNFVQASKGITRLGRQIGLIKPLSPQSRSGRRGYAIRDIVPT